MKSGSRLIWQGKSWRLRAAELALPDGGTLERAYIDHPGSVVLVPLRPTAVGHDVLMLSQYRFSLETTILELPAGTRTPGEAWLDCAQRELREETGLRAETFTALGQVWPAPGVSNELMTVFLATSLTSAPLPQDVDEEIVVQPYALAQLVEMAYDGRLQDAKSVVGILRAARYLRDAGR